MLGLLGLWALTAAPGPAAARAARSCSRWPPCLLLLVGLAAGAVQAIEPIETLVDGDGTTLYGTAGHHRRSASYVVLAAAIAAFGGVVYWAPKILGRLVPEGGARLVALLLLARHGRCGASPTSSPACSASPAVPGVVARRQPRHHRGARPVVAPSATACSPSPAWPSSLLLLGALRSDGDCPATTRGRATRSSGPPARRRPSATSPACPTITSEAPLYDARHRPEEADA